MSKYITIALVVLLIVVLLVFGFGALSVSVTNSMAGLAQAQANVSQAQANLVGQCMTGVVVVVALVAGFALGAAWVNVRQQVQELREARRLAKVKQGGSGKWVSGPNAGWQRVGDPRSRRRRLPRGQAEVITVLPQLQPGQGQPTYVVRPAEDGKTTFEDWGW